MPVGNIEIGNKEKKKNRKLQVVCKITKALDYSDCLTLLGRIFPRYELKGAKNHHPHHHHRHHPRHHHLWLHLNKYNTKNDIKFNMNKEKQYKNKQASVLPPSPPPPPPSPPTKK